MSSDFAVSSSWRMCAAPYASSAQTSISPKRWPPNCALPPSGCCVERVRARRARVDLVVHEVQELQDVHEADGHLLVEGLAGAPAEEAELPGAAPARPAARVDVELDRRVRVLRRPID